MNLAGSSAFFRVDASRHIGSGHVMRALTLADELKLRGVSCRFAGKAGEGDLLDAVRSRGHEAYALNAHAQNVPGVSASFDWQADAREVANVLGDAVVDTLICDHYGIDARWEGALRKYCKKLVVVDDLADRRHDCDLLIDQNLGRAPDYYAELVPRSCVVLAGPGHALLRPQFAQARPGSLARRAARRGGITRVLVSMGGADEPNATRRLLTTLSAHGLLSGCTIDVVLGAASRWLADIRALSAESPLRVEIHSNVADMAGLMSDCDFAVGASGGTSWERCCLGLPTLIVVLADNQWPGARALAAAGAARVLGEVSDIETQLPSALSLLGDRDVLATMSMAAAQVCDGKGVERVMKYLERM